MGIIPAYAGSTTATNASSPTVTDHPRIRGEHLYFDKPQTRNCGSSPHTRGALMFWTGGETERGIIPAYAGSTAGARAYTPSRPGSSPHTRGAPVRVPVIGGEMGIIPAYAGSTIRPPSRSRRPRDHPRIRGEHGRVLGDIGPGDGSSPHTRGAHLRQDRQLFGAGIIPAYAGSTQCAGIRLGERSGSSPHTRGALNLANTRNPLIRIIPAYAGSTRRRGMAASGSPDHPRIRGEHRRCYYFPLDRCGSSPHTRGALRQVRLGSPGRGIIPAYAGSTRARSVRFWRRWDHPRIRGEHRRPAGSGGGPAGSSPHTRGAPLPYHRGTSRVRIIPAYAGSTRAPARIPHLVQDHPRIRGEHGSPPPSTTAIAGSSPHTRGARRFLRRVGVEQPDHPRIRGEHRPEPEFW